MKLIYHFFKLKPFPLLITSSYPCIYCISLYKIKKKKKKSRLVDNPQKVDLLFKQRFLIHQHISNVARIRKYFESISKSTRNYVFTSPVRTWFIYSLLSPDLWIIISFLRGYVCQRKHRMTKNKAFWTTFNGKRSGKLSTDKRLVIGMERIQ